MKNSGFYYMLVTNDIYELPKSPPMTSEEMGKLLGKTRQQIYNICSTLKSGKNRHINKGVREYCIVSIRLD